MFWTFPYTMNFTYFNIKSISFTRNDETIMLRLASLHHVEYKSYRAPTKQQVTQAK